MALESRRVASSWFDDKELTYRNGHRCWEAGDGDYAIREGESRRTGRGKGRKVGFIKKFRQVCHQSFPVTPTRYTLLRLIKSCANASINLHSESFREELAPELFHEIE